jgi:hypothetical protein
LITKLTLTSNFAAVARATPRSRPRPRRARADPPNMVVPSTAGLLDPAVSLNHNNHTL